MSIDKSRIATDLIKHVDDKLDVSIDDYLDRCELFDISREDAMVMVVTLLGARFVAMALTVDATEQEFIGLCQWHYRRGVAALAHSRKQT